MSERLLSVGLDVGTSTTQLIVSALTVENRASPFAVPEMVITGRDILYQSPVRFTPLLDEARVDGVAIRDLVTAEYAKAGISRQDVDTGAVIITGETSRKENARAVLDSLSDIAGDFVVATAGPDLESRLAAKGSGAAALSEETGKTVLHFDIGGGTSNLAWIEAGEIRETGCLNIGGRLIKYGKNKEIYYVSPVLRGICSMAPGDTATEETLTEIAGVLTKALEMAAGLRERTALLDSLVTNHTVTPPGEGTVFSFSGGVADCIEPELPWDAFGDMGVTLGRAIRDSRLCRGTYTLGRETIRATVIGAGCHSAQLSGSTVFVRDGALPLKNLPVVGITQAEQALPPEALGAVIARRLGEAEGTAALALPGLFAPHYGALIQLAEGIVLGFGSSPVRVVLEADMAKALGHALALRLPKDRALLCLDRIRLPAESYLDVGRPVGQSLPVVVKTLVLSRESQIL